MIVDGLPSGARSWRHRVADVARGTDVADGVELLFRLPEGRWVDLDTITETTLAGLRDAAALPPRYTGLDAIVATRTAQGPAGVTVRPVPARVLARRRPPGPALVSVSADAIPGPTRDAKRVWRDRISDAWRDRDPLNEPVWADVVLAARRSLLGPLEVILDALEPVLGRDARGREWQEFFPNDHVITWLRVRRTGAPAAAPLTLRLGAAARSQAR